MGAPTYARLAALRDTYMTDVPDTASRERNRAHELEARALLQWRRAVRYAKEVLAWNRLYRAASYLRSALWVVPFIAIVVVLATMPLLRILDDWLNWKPILAEEGAQASAR